MTTALLLAVGVTYLLIAPHAMSLTSWVARIAWAFAAVVLFFGPGRGIAAFLLWDSAMGAKRYEQWHGDPMEGLAEHFSWLVQHASKPILFCVDDLDRCDEGHVVELLDSIQTLVRDVAPRDAHVYAPCFIVAADGRWIRRSYERTHEGFDEAVGEPGRPLGYLFLDKLFQLTVEVPTIGRVQQETYLRHLLLGVGHPAELGEYTAIRERIAHSTNQREIIDAVNDSRPTERAAVTAAAIERLSEPRIGRATEHDLQKFAEVLERNPRSMKRFVNAYSMARVTALLEGRQIDPDRLALWTILRLRWPDLAERLKEDPECLNRLRAGASPSDLPDRLVTLSASREFARVLDFEGARLSSEAIQALAGAY